MNIHARVWGIISESLFGSDQADSNDALAGLLQSADDLWPQVIHLADTSFLSPGLWKALKNRDLAQFVPEDPAQYLRAIYDMNTTRNAALESQLDELLLALAAAGIEPGLIKGAAHLKTNLHRDKGVRLLTDLDLIIQTDQLQNTARVLNDLGYATLPDTDTDESDHHHLPAFFRRGEYGSVEVHKEPMNLQARSCLQAGELWRDSIGHCQRGMRYRTPSPTHSALIAIVHSEVADRNLRKLIVNLRALQDVVAMQSTHEGTPDWPAIHHRMQQAGHERIFQDFLYVLKQVADCEPLPELHFGLRSRARYLACLMAMRRSFFQRWLIRFNDMSAYRIQQRFGARQTFLSRNRNRLRVVGAFIAKHLGLARNSR